MQEVEEINDKNIVFDVDPSEDLTVTSHDVNKKSKFLMYIFLAKSMPILDLAKYQWNLPFRCMNRT